MTLIYYCISPSSERDCQACPPCVMFTNRLVISPLFSVHFENVSVLLSLPDCSCRSLLEYVLSHLVTSLSLTCIRLSPPSDVYSDVHQLPFCAQASGAFIRWLYTFGFFLSGWLLWVTFVLKILLYLGSGVCPNCDPGIFVLKMFLKALPIRDWK